MTLRKGKWASPGKKGTPSKTRRRSLNKSSLSSVSRTQSTSAVKKPLAANIKVAVRVRPENEREQAGSYDNIINVVDKNMLVFDPKDCDDTFFFKGKTHKMRDLNKKQKKDKNFTFDNVYDEDSTNQEVFEGTTKGIVDTLFDGYNCCVFAYGATGAGKTHTMLGNQNNPGITFLTMKEIFEKQETIDDMNFEIFLSYIEVYNEGLRDLLDPSKTLIIREDGKAGTTIAGMTMLKPQSPDEVLNLLSMGNNNRSQHPTDHNKESSRSHAILQIILQQKPKDAGLKAEVKTAKLSMIDLAGSEKGTATGHKGARFREGSNINKSLLALGNCINALAAGSKYIPYRDSKLTRLLKDSVGGNCATVMIANVSPSSLTYEDTLNTLKYADRAKQIKVDLKKNVVNVEFHVAQYAKIVENLQSEIEALKTKIKILEEENEDLKVNGGPVAAAGSGQAALGSPGIADKLAAATSGQMDIDMDLDSLSVITKLKQQLAVLMERQKDYDQLQEQLNSHRETQDKNGNLLKENEALRQRIETLEKQCTELQTDKINNTDQVLEELVTNREHILELIGNERSLLSALELRIHYKTLQAERCNLIGIVNSEKEKSEVKMNKSIESLKKKAERKKERLENLLIKFNAENKSIQEQLSRKPISSTAIAAPSRLSLEEHKTENILLHCVITSMEREFTRVNKQFLEAIPILVRNERLIRGLGASSREDKEQFSELQAHIQSAEGISFAHDVKDPVSEETEYNVFKECCNLNLPSLSSTRRKSSSMEQKILFSDTMESTQMDTGNDQTDCGVRELSTFEQESSTQDDSSSTMGEVSSSFAPKETDKSTHEYEVQPTNKVVLPSTITQSSTSSTYVPLTSTAHSPAAVTGSVSSGFQSSRFEPATFPKSSITSIKTQEVKPLSDLSPLKPIESFDSILNRMKEAKKETTEEIPPTPQLTKQNSGGQLHPLGVQPRNKSFLDRLPVSESNIAGRESLTTVSSLSNLTVDGGKRSSDIGIFNSQGSKDNLNETVTLDNKPEHIVRIAEVGNEKKRPLPLELTNTRKQIEDLNDSDSLESPGKKAKTLNETYCHVETDGPSAWLSHRGSVVIPDSPLVLGELAQSPNVVDATFTKEDSPSTSLEVNNKGKTSLNVTGAEVLLQQLDSKCAISPPGEQKKNVSAASSVNLNSTFPVEDVEMEPMDVDATANIHDISVIPAPKRSPNQMLGLTNKSPVKATMGASPKFFAKRAHPSPLRESTLLDLKKDPSKPATLPEAATQPVTAGSTTSNDPHVFLPPSSTNKLGAMMQSSSKSGTKAVKLLSSTNSTKGKRTLTSSRSTSSVLHKPAAAHKLNLPPHPSRSRSPGAPLRVATSPSPPSYASATTASNNKIANDRKIKGSENQRPGINGGGITIKSTGLKRSNSLRKTNI